MLLHPRHPAHSLVPTHPNNLKRQPQAPYKQSTIHIRHGTHTQTPQRTPHPTYCSSSNSPASPAGTAHQPMLLLPLHPAHCLVPADAAQSLNIRHAAPTAANTPHPPHGMYTLGTAHSKLHVQAKSSLARFASSLSATAHAAAAPSAPRPLSGGHPPHIPKHQPRTPTQAPPPPHTHTHTYARARMRHSSLHTPRTTQVQTRQVHQLAQRNSQCRFFPPCTKLIPWCHPHSTTAQHESHSPTDTPLRSAAHSTCHVQLKFRLVRFTSSPNPPANAATPSAPSLAGCSTQKKIGSEAL